MFPSFYFKIEPNRFNNEQHVNKQKSIVLNGKSSMQTVMLSWPDHEQMISQKVLRIRTRVYISCLILIIAFNYDSNKTGCVYNTCLYETSYSYRAWVICGIVKYSHSAFQKQSNKSLFRSDVYWHFLSKGKRALFLMETQTHCLDLST